MTLSLLCTPCGYGGCLGANGRGMSCLCARTYLQLLRDQKWWIAAGLLFGMLGGQVIALTSVRSDVATTTLYFGNRGWR